MDYGICTLSIIPCRKEPGDRSEMVTQLLFGETFAIINRQDKWLQIVSTYDNYECWIGDKQYLPLSETEFNSTKSNTRFAVNEVISVITNKDLYTSFPCVAGSLLPNFEEDNFNINLSHYNYEGELCDLTHKNSRSLLVEKAYEFLNAPYLWGGRSVLGIDCSGFTQLVFKLNGFTLFRDAWQQAEQGQTLSFLEEAKEGDLAFFDNEDGKIIHVGIILKDNMIIHASGKVRIDKLDHYGIFNNETKNYSHRLRVLKRVIEE